MSSRPSGRVRPLFLVFIGLLVITEIVILNPSPLEDPRTPLRPMDPSIFVEDLGKTRAPGVPKNRIPQYSVDQFSYVSVQNGERLWKIEAKKAYMYNPERLVHSLQVKAYLYDPDGSSTVVTGKEAKYVLNQKDLEVYGDVVTEFADGFVLKSDYLRYLPGERRIIIPDSYSVHVEGKETDQQKLSFVSQGMDYKMAEALVKLPRAVQVTMEKKYPGKPVEKTIIDSDECVIFRSENLAKFTMYTSRPLKERFVHITQPDLFTRSRRADLHYGNNNAYLDDLVAYDDVLIKETGKGKSLRYATSGRADFDNRRNLIVLTQYPQVYQDEDTVTGDVVLMHRDTDVIEVEQSNAFTLGQEKHPANEPSPNPKPSSGTSGNLKSDESLQKL